MLDQNGTKSKTEELDNFYPWNKCRPPFQMTLLDSDTLLCLIKLINCLMDHKSADILMGPRVLC